MDAPKAKKEASKNVLQCIDITFPHMAPDGLSSFLFLLSHSFMTVKNCLKL
jgi:hypothetical protein